MINVGSTVYHASYSQLLKQPSVTEYVVEYYSPVSAVIRDKYGTEKRRIHYDNGNLKTCKAPYRETRAMALRALADEGLATIEALKKSIVRAEARVKIIENHIALEGLTC